MKTDYIYMKTVQINNELQKQCKAIYNNCCNMDKLKHPCCFEDEFDVFTDYPRLYYVSLENRLLGFLSAYIIDSNSVEFCIFIHPDYRNKQLAKRLLKNFLIDYNMPNIEVSVHPENKSGINFLKKYDFCLASTEVLMNVPLNAFIPKNISKPTFRKVFSSNTFKYMIHNECVGSCNISYLSDRHICISDVEIFEKYQNKGLGYQFMEKVLREMSLYFSDVLLHVTKENIAAYKLYKKLGFVENDSTLIYTLIHNTQHS